jgi:subtilisin-like proprotein convertase family protein
MPGSACAVALGLVVMMAGTAFGNPPPPPNDQPPDAIVIGPDVPILVLGTTVLADDSISVTTLPAPANDVDGPDVFYRFTPDATDTYRVQLLPWQGAPLRSSDYQFTIYLYDSGDVFLGGARAPGAARPVHFDVALTQNETYTIGVDYNATTHDNFPFTLMVDVLDGANPDTCATAEVLPSQVPVVVLNDIDAAAADYTFSQSTGRCGVAGTTPTTAPGNDHVYMYRPPATGDYAIELGSSTFDGVLYVDDTCPPDFNDSCLGASNHSTGGTSGGRHEFIVVTLEADTDYYIYVDNGSTTSTTGPYALIIHDAAAYEINEIEPNDAPANATPIDTPLNGGQLVGPTDEDWWAVTGDTGARVYAWVNNGGSLNSTLDTDLAFYAADGQSLIEFDDEDGDGADAPIEDLRFVYSTSAPVLAGVQFTSNATHYLRVTDTSATGTVHRYRLHVGVEPASRAPLSECEPNDSLAQADRTAKHFFTGVMDRVEDRDVYAFDAEVGDRVFIALDGDPERDGTGDQPPNNDPRAFHAKLVVYDPAGDALISDISDANSIQDPPDYPAQGGFFFARTAGRHYVEVAPQSSASQVGPEETYTVAIFLNDAPPALSEDRDPSMILNPDHGSDTIAVRAMDDAEDDSGICSVTLFADTNLELRDLNFQPGDPVVTFTVGLLNGNASGFGKLLVTDCAGNTACAVAKIDVFPPTCDGANFSNRSPRSLHGPIHVPDNDLNGINGTIDIAHVGTITDVNVTVTIETIRPPDIDCFLEAPDGTRVELFTDRGSSLVFDITEATFDDDADVILPITSGEAPYTGTWKPEDPEGLAKLIGHGAQGTWKLNVVDDAGSGSGAGGGARLVRWRLDVDATFAAPESYSGTALDVLGFDCGIDRIELLDADNVQLVLPDDFESGDTDVPFLVELIDPSMDGSGRVLVTDLAENTCERQVNLSGLPDVLDPVNTGSNTTDRTFGAEVQVLVPPADPGGVVSSVSLSDSFLVGEVEVDLVIDTKDVGRLASTLTHGGMFASLINRVGMDERDSVGLTKDNVEITLDDDAPVEDDAHLEPASGAIEFLGLHQPDGRGGFIGNGIVTDDRDNMMFTLDGLDGLGTWDLLVADYRLLGAGSAQSVFRRWSGTVKNECGPERYVARVIDLPPGLGICAIDLPTNFNMQVEADFDPGDAVVDYVVSTVNRETMGEGLVRITDCAGNETEFAIHLLPGVQDPSLPVITGAVNPATFEFEGHATDDGPDDTGIDSVSLHPYGYNLEVVSVNPDPPNGADAVDFVIGLVDAQSNGRGYVAVTDLCGLSSHALVHIDSTTPDCSGSVGHTRRFVSTDTPIDLPDNDPAGVQSIIEVDADGVIDDVNVTLDITHGFDDDIDATIASPRFVELFTDVGSTGNDFTDTTLDDEAGAPIPDDANEAPFTGVYQPEGGPSLSALDGLAVRNTYFLQVVDDKTNDFGRLERWAITIESSSFPERYDGRAEDNEQFASGICSIELLPDARNLNLTTDVFSEGAAIVRYSVDLCGGGSDGLGTARITDCAGNTCDVPIVLQGVGTKGDMDASGGPIDLDDYALFHACFTGPDGTPYECGHPCRLADFDDNGLVDLRDAAGFQAAFEQ